MAGIATDDEHDTASADELAIFADTFNAGAHFHDQQPSSASGRSKANEYKPKWPNGSSGLPEKNKFGHAALKTYWRSRTGAKSFQLASEIHVSGRAIVWTGPKEVAELKRDQIRSAGPDLFAAKKVTYPLGVVLEPLPMPAGRGTAKKRRVFPRTTSHTTSNVSGYSA